MLMHDTHDGRALQYGTGRERPLKYRQICKTESCRTRLALN